MCVDVFFRVLIEELVGVDVCVLPLHPAPNTPLPTNSALFPRSDPTIDPGLRPPPREGGIYMTGKK